jgi:subtilisin family serine protease
MTWFAEQRRWRGIVAAVGLAATIGGGAWWCRRSTDDNGATRAHRAEPNRFRPLAAEIHIQHRASRSAISRPYGQPEFPGSTDPELARWEVAVVPESLEDSTLARLALDPDVAEAFSAPDFVLPSELDEPAIRRDGDSCPIKTPEYHEHQGYLDAAPGGIDAVFAWHQGIRGAGVWFADVEGAWNTSHEDLPGSRITVLAKQVTGASWRAHGTAVLGEVVGSDNGKGVIGIAPDVERVFVSPIARTNVGEAIDRAARQLRAGDVLLIELQSTGPRGRYLPVEYWDDVYDAIRAATNRGVVVIEAAGNGGEDLDNRHYEGKLSRSGRDSGAILVGAGAPPRAGFTDRERLDFSNYGSRLDVQGWGRKVATLDYGDLQACDGSVDRHYTGEFAGTSSASPIVAGAAILIEARARREGGALTPNQVRDLLRRTGTPQVRAKQQPIGPRPDLARALQELDRTH